MKAKIERHDDLTIINLNGKLTTGGPDVLLRQKMGEHVVNVIVVF